MLKYVCGVPLDIYVYINKSSSKEIAHLCKEGKLVYVKYFNDLKIDLGDYIWFRGKH